MATSMATSAAEYAVELTGITKRFPGVVANTDIHLQVRRGEVHALCGENGAGKSTLMKILYGMQQPDEGTISVDGQIVRFRSPSDAIKAGIGMVHQHFMLADNLTVRGERAARRRGHAWASGPRPAGGSPSWPTRSGLERRPATSWSSGSEWPTGSGWRSSRCSTAAPAP